MRDPWENDPDNLIEMEFVQEAGVTDLATAAVAAALREIEKGYPNNPKADASLKERARRIRNAFPDTDLIALAVAEFLTGARHGAAAASIKAALVDAENLARQVAELQKRLGALGADLQLSVRTDAGEEIMNGAVMASAAASDALSSLMIAAETLRARQCHAPTEARGRGGALSAMRRSPDVALLCKLEQLWQIAGLRTSGGRAGHGLDVFLSHALAADDPKRVSGKDWIGKLRAKMKLELSTEIRPPELP